jgi:membrane-bound metal-dependent hydrolase YbcI (DUF457 family)
MALAWTAERVSPPGTTDDVISPARLTVLCAVLAALPDADLLYSPIHRTVTHSLASAAVVFSIAVAVTGWVTARSSRGSQGAQGSPGAPSASGAWGAPAVWRVALICAAAWGSHVVMDWLGADNRPPYGIQALWPFSRDWFIAPWTIFPGTERRDPLSMRAILINAKAAAAEVGLMGTAALAAWWARRERRSRNGEAYSLK